jgi:hypothetical protein
LRTSNRSTAHSLRRVRRSSFKRSLEQRGKEC